ncbi:MAG TPA: RHS repeat-associated core domain-containing protein [Allocoleopsis sp.]
MRYYPFGLMMSGISDNALNFGQPENKYKYNGIEKENEFELGIYDAQLRELDGQTGRWWQIDPKIESMEMWSPYASNYNNPILYSDPLGDEPDGCCKWLRDATNWIGEKLDAIGNSKPVVWINNNLNPVTPVAEFFSGKSLNSGFTEDKPRLESATQAATFLIPTAKAETIIANEFKNVVVGQVEKQIVINSEKNLVKYEVGTANNLAKKSVKGDGLDIHHVSQSKPAGQVIKGYNKENAPAIALSAAEHKVIPTLKGTNTAGNARQQLAKDIKDLRSYSNAPNSSLQKLIELNKKMFPNSFIK